MKQEEEDGTSLLSLFFLLFPLLSGFDDKAELQTVGLGSDGSEFCGVSAETGAAEGWSRGEEGEGGEGAGVSIKENKIKWAVVVKKTYVNINMNWDKSKLLIYLFLISIKKIIL